MIRNLFFVCILCMIFTLSKPNNSFASEPFINIGPQVTYANAFYGRTGATSSGIPLLYTLLQGSPAKLVVYNLHTNEIFDSQELQGATGAWSIYVYNQQVWIGSTPNEHLYSYDPDKKLLKDIGKATTSTNTTIWDLEYDSTSNTVYGSTSYGGNIFRYSENNGFQNLGIVMEGKKYARSIAYDKVQKKLFVGLGSPAELIAWDFKTNKKIKMLPETYKGDSVVYDLNLVGDILFAKMVPSNKIVYFNANTLKYLGEFSADSRGVSPPNEDVIYYSNKGSLYQFNLNSYSTTRISSDLYGASAVSLDFSVINGRKTLVGLAGNGGRLYKYIPDLGQFNMELLSLPPQPVEIYSIGADSVGNIYSSGFVRGDLGIYLSNTNKTSFYTGIGQIEGMENVNGKMYFGTYPNAKIYSYNPSANWSKNTNPSEILNLGIYGQDRPVALESVPSENKLFIGTFPQRGKSNGLLAIYDTLSKSLINTKTIVPNQSVTSLEYNPHDQRIYGGTSISNGVGNDNQSAKLFSIPVHDADAKPEFIALPDSHITLISDLMATPDGCFWVLADGNVYVFESMDKDPIVIPIVQNATSGTVKNGRMLLGGDGNVYGTVEGNLFRIEGSTYKMQILKTKGAYEIAQDKNKNIYYTDGLNLWKANVNDLAEYIPPIRSNLEIPHVELPTGHKMPIARLHVRKPVNLLKYNGPGSYQIVKTLKANEFYRVYGTKGNYYDVGGGYYVNYSPNNIALYIGRVLIKTPTPLYSPNGEITRMLFPGEALRVYDYNENKYAVGGGYYVLKNNNTSEYYVGEIEIKAKVILRNSGNSSQSNQLPIGIYRVYGLEKDKILLGNGNFINWDKTKMEYKKN